MIYYTSALHGLYSYFHDELKKGGGLDDSSFDTFISILFRSKHLELPINTCEVDDALEINLASQEEVTFIYTLFSFYFSFLRKKRGSCPQLYTFTH